MNSETLSRPFSLKDSGFGALKCRLRRLSTKSTKPVIADMNENINPIAKWLNLVISILYATFNLLVFVAFQLLAISAPLGVAYLSWQLGKTTIFGFGYYLLAFGACVGALITAQNIVAAIRPAFATPADEYSLLNDRLLTVVQDVVQQVGVAPFRGIRLYKELEISTYYTAAGRYLNLSLIVLK